jgi:acetyl-CoA synthetase
MEYPYQLTTFEKYQQAWQKSIEDPEGFWGEIADTFTWKSKWSKY